jgi:hypothetical protein
MNIYEISGRQAEQLEQAYAVQRFFLNTINDLVTGKISHDRVTVDLTANKLTINESLPQLASTGAYPEAE